MSSTLWRARLTNDRGQILGEDYEIALHTLLQFWACFVCAPLFAVDQNDVQKLIDGGKYTEAVGQAAALLRSPNVVAPAINTRC